AHDPRTYHRKARHTDCGRQMKSRIEGAWWSLPPEDLVGILDSSATGLSSAEAAGRLSSAGRNEIVQRRPYSAAQLIGAQLGNPLALVLVAAAALCWATKGYADAAIIVLIVVASAVIGFWREWDAGKALVKLTSRLSHQSKALRDGALRSIDSAELVPGDL